MKNNPTRHIKHKVINVTTSNQSNMTNKLPSTNLDRFQRLIKSPLTR